MSEPASATIGSILGMKYAAVVAGAIGAVVSLRYIDDLSMVGRIIAIFTGAVVAGYGSPVAAGLLDLSKPGENAAAFVFGLTAMNIVPGLLQLSKQFASDPLSFIRASHSRRRDDP